MHPRAAIYRERQRVKRREMVQQGLCRECGKPRHNDLIRCDDCHQGRLEDDRARREILAKHRICTMCGKVDTQGRHERCDDCRTKKKAYDERKRAERIANIAAGRCGRCGGPKKDMRFKHCQSCRDVYSRRMRERYHTIRLSRES